MDDNSEQYVLQWEGHAGHVTERFSGLLARQSLVDVTLICEEQRLRVHKLVLASCSLYFEEMLEQDLGQEPTILLSDLNFEVLKAMVEFMYCGETNISKQHLEPLLHAAKLFKVKELACITENMLGSQNALADQVESCTEFLEEDTNELEDGNEYSLFSDNDSQQISIWDNNGSDAFCDNELEETEDIQVVRTCASRSSSPNNNILDVLEPTLYEEVGDAQNFSLNLNKLVQSQVPLSITENTCNNLRKPYRQTPVDSRNESFEPKTDFNIEREDNVDVFSDDDRQSPPVLYDQCCDFVNSEGSLSDCVEIPFSPTQPYLEAKCNNVLESSPKFKGVTRTVKKCLKVYTHKKRKSIEGSDKKFTKTLSDLPEIPVSNNCIDLIEEPSKNETELQREDLLSLSNANVEAILDFANREENVYSSAHVNANSPVNYKYKPARQMKEIFSSDNRILAKPASDTIIYRSSSLCTPTLRRSMRLSHQENDDSVNNNSLQAVDKTKGSRKESFFSNAEVPARLKRKNKDETECCEADENKMVPESTTKCKLTPPRSLRGGTSKFISRRATKASLSLSKGSGDCEQKGRANNKPKRSEVGEDEQCGAFSNKFNTIATVSRALWGDMTDYLENSQKHIDFPDYSPSKEIPFAVGLLPLRAALERMQAMPDYQPRKTRSSTCTPFRQEPNGAKRKHFGGNIDSNNSGVKRQNTHSSDNLNGNTVCHVHITTSQSQPRRRLLTEQITTTIPPTNIFNGQ